MNLEFSLRALVAWKSPQVLDYRRCAAVGIADIPVSRGEDLDGNLQVSGHSRASLLCDWAKGPLGESKI